MTERQRVLTGHQMSSCRVSALTGSQLSWCEPPCTFKKGIPEAYQLAIQALQLVVQTLQFEDLIPWRAYLLNPKVVTGDSELFQVRLLLASEMVFIPGVPQVVPFPRKQPLPPNPYDQLTDMPSFDSYRQCLLHEMEAIATNNKLRLIYARCLGYLISEAPTTSCRNVIVHEITECKADPNELDELADLYINHLLRLCECKPITTMYWSSPFTSSAAKRTYPFTL
jgi:hypothetical protein